MLEDATKVEDGVGLVHVYTGNGKGKTTSSLGLALRAIGHGYKVLMIQFIKGGAYSGEVVAADKIPDFTIFQYGQECPWSSDIGGSVKCGSCRYCFSIHKEDYRRSEKALSVATEAARRGHYKLIVLDEINIAANKGLVKIEGILDLIRTKHPSTELVLTGRYCPKEIIDAADLVTEMVEVKHPYQQGIEARIGIDF